jgi:anti-sigma regulatory factor (Ser/Thr protein kinase)
MWLLAENRFNQAALSFARDHGVMTSNWSQFGLLMNRLAPTSQISEQVMAQELTTFEMIIPVTADSELVPVRALEQIAENLNFEDKAKGQIRMAVMEACINAKEYTATPGGKIRLRFQGNTDALLINFRIETLVPKDEPRGKPTGEVWNLKLLRSLMDEARISHGPSGLELSMTKYLSKTLTQAG